MLRSQLFLPSLFFLILALPFQPVNASEICSIESERRTWLRFEAPSQNILFSSITSKNESFEFISSVGIVATRDAGALKFCRPFNNGVSVGKVCSPLGKRGQILTDKILVCPETRDIALSNQVLSSRAAAQFSSEKLEQDREIQLSSELATKEEAEKRLQRLSQTCTNFGYRKESEKFADCMKDLYLKETNSEQQSVQDNSATDAQLQVLRQQLELQRQQAAAAAEAEKRRQGFELMNQGLNTLNPSPPPPPSNRPLTCRTMSNGITTCQ